VEKFKALLIKVKDLALKPGNSWEALAQEEMVESYLLKSVLLPLTLMMAAGQFLGHWLVGTPIPRILGGGMVRLSFFEAFSNAIILGGLTAAGIWLFSKVINYLATRFDATANPLNALKLSVFSMAPYLAAGLLFVFPQLAVIITLVSIYCLYLFYQGLPVLMQAPKEKTLAYAVVSIVTLVLIYLIITLITTQILIAFAPNVY